MNPLKFIIGAIALLLLAIAIYMKIAGFEAHGGYTRGASWHNDTMTAYSVFFFAAVFAGCYVWMIIAEREKSHNHPYNFTSESIPVILRIHSINTSQSSEGSCSRICRTYSSLNRSYTPNSFFPRAVSRR